MGLPFRFAVSGTQASWEAGRVAVDLRVVAFTCLTANVTGTFFTTISSPQISVTSVVSNAGSIVGRRMTSTVAPDRENSGTKSELEKYRGARDWIATVRGSPLRTGW